MADDAVERAIRAYDPLAAELAPLYESITFEQRHGRHLDLLPASGSWVLDVGSGTGIDAAGFADRGYNVVAAEPSAGMRREAAARHGRADVRWMDDRLPDLAHVAALGRTFDFLLLQAVFMHLPEPTRAPALATLGRLANSGAVMALSLRHGPVPPGRIMYEIAADTVSDLAAAQGFSEIRRLKLPDKSGRPGVTWDRLYFRRDP